MAQTSQAKAQTMRAVALDKFGGPESLKIQNLPIPQIEAQEVLIRVEAAGVGAWDPFEREGRFVEIMGVKPKFPYVLGTDGAGTIAAVGKDVSRFKEGDRVYGAELANPKGGFYAQYAAVKADNASLIPVHLSIEQAAVLPTDGLTALTGLEKVLGLKSGESLMVFGASGGIGHLALQLAKRLGAKVFAIASGDDGVQLAKKLGADTAVDGRSDDVLKSAREFAPNGIDAALVAAGGERTDQALAAIRKGGRIAYPHGVMPEPKAPDGVEIEGYDGENNRALIDRLNALIDSGPFEVHVDRTFPLEEVSKAHKALDEHHLGKIALRIG
ncbi:MAG TPA: NADP-dependent oxidoreductase [Pyrinomonadaceae bacterium]|jgi:NADPH:quinone reductase-like Zn-dependent oxidoreductase|nr:NADP-dependent oxidoreductase [Pyrinomonadaceae bacterium]